MLMRASSVNALKHILYSPVLSDILDSLGRKNQMLPPKIQPLNPNTVIMGYAYPVVIEDSKDTTHYDKLFLALDSLPRNYVYVATGPNKAYALWGELMSTRAMVIGAQGAVIDGYVRDTKRIIELNFPVFCRGTYAKDQKGRGVVLDYNVPIKIGGVEIHPKDLIFGDIDGVVVIPRELIQEVIAQALEKAQKEKYMKVEILKGVPTKALFDKFGFM